MSNLRLISSAKKHQKNVIEKESKKPPIKGDFCFTWRTVELVECAANGKAILHFCSGKRITISSTFLEARESFKAFNKR